MTSESFFTSPVLMLVTALASSIQKLLRRCLHCSLHVLHDLGKFLHISGLDAGHCAGELIVLALDPGTHLLGVAGLLFHKHSEDGLTLLQIFCIGFVEALASISSQGGLDLRLTFFLCIIDL